MVQRCEKDGTSSASDRLHSLIEDREAFPSSLFSLETDHLLAPKIVTIMTILHRKPLSLWTEPEFYLLTKVMVIACGPAMVEKRAGKNESAERWLEVFSDSLAILPSDLRPASLWLFTFTSPHDTLLKPALKILASYGDASADRNRSLCQLRRRLLDRNVQCSTDFSKRLWKTMEYRHICFGCVGWGLCVVGNALGLRRRS